MRITQKIALYSVFLISLANANETSAVFTVPEQVQIVLQQTCIGCHNGETQEGQIRLDTLAELELDERLDLLNKAQDQLFFGLMPPEETESLKKEEQTVLSRWLRTELQAHKASNLDLIVNDNMTTFVNLDSTNAILFSILLIPIGFKSYSLWCV